MPAVAPVATYRVQLHRGFTFDDVARIASYLADLGVTHVYCSPFLRAVPGSTHGYDVVDHHRLDDERGGHEGFARMTAALERAGLGAVADVVPNHMAADPQANAWLRDVLENGPSSRYAAYFDIDWKPPEERLHQRVLLPVLGEHYGTVLEGGGISVERDEGALVARVGEVTVPLSPRSLEDLLARAAVAAASDELASIAVFLGRLPPASATDVASVDERHRDKEVLRRQLARLLAAEPDVAESVDGAIADLNADPDALDELLQRQSFRLAHWKVASRELDYRRFFDVADLMAVRTEDYRVFADSHELLFELVAAGHLAGLRIDHPDGLRDPAGYFTHLRRRIGPDPWVVVEKILSPGEDLPEEWAASIQGTTGYEFLNRLTGLFVDPAAEAAFTTLYRDFTGEAEEFGAEARAAKEQVLRETLAADVRRLTNLVVAVGERQRRARDFTRHDLDAALRAVASSFEAYRTYVRPGREPDPAEVARVERAVAEGAARRPDLDPGVWDFLADLLLLRLPDDSGAIEVAMRFQQLTGPVMAKGVEDTAFYRYHRLVCLNEVGGEPDRFGFGVDEFHEANAMVADRWPATMLTTSTHDTKRSEDVRARLALLSEVPGEWEEAVRRWSAAAAPLRTGDHPDRATEYLLWQTLVGAWPLTPERLVAYLEKASREAKRHTSWTDPDPDYDAALRRFAEAVMADDAVMADVAGFVAPLVEPGRVNSLAQVLLKLTAPGVPDVYQGCELWDLSLVDPDNRRPVDYEARAALLSKLTGAGEAGAAQALALADEGGPKLWLTHRALATRRRRPADLGPGAAYRALPVEGDREGHAVAFLRGEGVAVVVPRLVLGLRAAGGWGDAAVRLPPGRWSDTLGGEVVEGGSAPVPLSRLLARFPVALLEREG